MECCISKECELSKNCEISKNCENCKKGKKFDFSKTKVVAGDGVFTPGTEVLTGANKTPMGNSRSKGARGLAWELEAEMTVSELVKQFGACLVVKYLVSLLGDFVLDNLATEKIMVQAVPLEGVPQEVPFNPVPVEPVGLKCSEDFK
ncbi:hypothetical protein KI387_022738, partial [Taxus chinensis]